MRGFGFAHAFAGGPGGHAAGGVGHGVRAIAASRLRRGGPKAPSPMGSSLPPPQAGGPLKTDRPKMGADNANPYAGGGY